MHTIRYVKLFAIRHALSAGLAVFAAFIINHYYSFSQEYWMVLAAFLVSQTTRGTPVKQGVFIFITILFAIIASSLLVSNIENNTVLYALLSALIIGSGYLTFIIRPQSSRRNFLMLLFSIVILIATLSPVKSLEFMQNRLIDAAIGSFIGILCTRIILPVKLDVEFSQGIIPVLNLLNEYSQALTESLLSSNTGKKKSTELRIKIENALQAQAMYPEWVYEVGFNRGLRSGFRFFLVNVERIVEVYFAIDSLISRGMDTLLLRDLYSHIENAMWKNQELISILIEYFKNKRILGTQSDFTSDMASLEKALHRVVPDNIEVLDISPNFLLITALIRDIRDLRGLLLQLVMALPATKH